MTKYGTLYCKLYDAVSGFWISQKVTEIGWNKHFSANCPKLGHKSEIRALDCIKFIRKQCWFFVFLLFFLNIPCAWADRQNAWQTCRSLAAEACLSGGAVGSLLAATDLRRHLVGGPCTATSRHTAWQTLRCCALLKPRFSPWLCLLFLLDFLAAASGHAAVFAAVPAGPCW